MYIRMQRPRSSHPMHYGVTMISRLLKIIVLFCRISSFLHGSFAKDTYNFKEPTNRNQTFGELNSCELGVFRF